MSRKLKINIVLPFLNQSPGGGLKVMYQYANQFAKNGHDVVIYHSMYTSWTHSDRLIRKRKHIFFQKYLKLKRLRYPSWFPLDRSIESFEIAEVADVYIRDADIVFCTWWATAIEVSSLNDTKGAKFNLIQDYEIIMTTYKDLVHQSYKLNLYNVAVSNYLADKVASITGSRPQVIPNAIDTSAFFIQTAIKARNPRSICMLYADAERKGSVYGIEALKIVAEKYPDLRVDLFGVYEHPKLSFPENFNYHYLPQDLRHIYNGSAIFISPSIHEGWGLPPMEAMACGCACVCTKIEGHLDFMAGGQNALLVEPADPEQMAEKVLMLIESQSVRIQLAYTGNKDIQQFSWGNSYNSIIELFTTLK
jgi:glycosyltransferase involved in cell wall biosynthesis